MRIKKHYRTLLLLPFTALMLSLTACGGKSDNPEQAQPNPTESTKSAPAEHIDYVIAAPAFAKGGEDGIAVVVDNETVAFDTPPIVENNQILIPLGEIAEAAGMTAVYDEKTQGMTLTKTATLLQLPLDSDNPFVEGGMYTIRLTPNGVTTGSGGVEKPYDMAAKPVDGKIALPLGFVSDVMDMDAILSQSGIGVLNGHPGILINSRLRGSAPLAGESVFASVSPELISVEDNDGNRVSLGMDVTEMVKNIGEPALAWGRGVPSPQINYEYAENFSGIEDMGKAYAEIICTLGKVTIIQVGPDSGSKLRTGAGVAAGDSIAEIQKAYGLSDADLKSHTTDGNIVLTYNGETLTDSQADITHVVHFIVSDDKINAIAIADIVSASELTR